jgi:hypothetical protein
VVFSSKAIDILATPYALTYEFHANSTDTLKYDYADNTKPITYDLWTQWEALEEPAVDKIFDWIKLYCFDDNLFVPFVARVRTYINYNKTTTIDDFELNFSSSSVKELFKKLKATKCRVMSIRITTSAIHTKPTITGIETVAALPYSIERVR